MRPILSLDRLIHLLMFVFRYSGVKDINYWGKYVLRHLQGGILLKPL